MEALLGAFLVGGGENAALALLLHLDLLPGGWMPVSAEACAPPPGAEGGGGGSILRGPDTDVAAVEVALG